MPVDVSEYVKKKKKKKIVICISNVDFLLLLQGRHTKTGQLAAIKVMDVTEVCYCCEMFWSLYFCTGFIYYS